LRGLFLINYFMKKFKKLNSVVTVFFAFLQLAILIYATPQLKMHSILLFLIGFAGWFLYLKIHIPAAIKFFKGRT